MLTSWYEWCKQRLWFVIPACIIGPAAIIGLIYGIGTREGDEGFIQKNGKDLVWPKVALPLACMYDDSVKSEARYLQQAIRKLNDACGFTLVSPCLAWSINAKFPENPIRYALLVKMGGPPIGDDETQITVSSPYDPTRGGSTLLFDVDGLLYGSIIYMSAELPENSEIKLNAWVHELGHVVGLAHDYLTDSVMFPRLDVRSMDFSNKDIKLLVRTYRQ